MLGVELVEPALGLHDVLGVPLDVRGFSLEPAGRLVDHDAGVGQRDAQVRLARHQQERAHRGGHAHAHGRDRALDVLHGVVDRQAAGDDAARRVDVHVDLLLGVLALEIEQLGADQRRQGVVDRAVQEHHPLAQQPREDVERPLAAAGLLHHHWNEVERGAANRQISHQDVPFKNAFGRPPRGPDFGPVISRPDDAVATPAAGARRDRRYADFGLAARLAFGAADSAAVSAFAGLALAAFGETWALAVGLAFALASGSDACAFALPPFALPPFALAAGLASPP